MPGSPGSGGVPGPDVTVTQGPEWLVELYLTPPAWVNPAIKLVGLLALAVVGWRLYQQGWTVDAETQLQMGIIAGTVVGVVTGVLAMANLTSQPYAVDVTVGFVIGYGTVLTASSARVMRLARRNIPDETTRRTSAWMLLGVLAVVAPALVAVHGRGMQLLNGRLAIALVSVCMVGLNVRERTRLISQ